MNIYLGGSIKGKDFENANGWRAKATGLLEQKGHVVINPLRGRTWCSKEEQKQFTMPEIIHRDLMDVDRSDCLLVEYTEPNKYQYVGTITEMARARMDDKVIIIFTNGEVETFGWLAGYLATRIFSTMEEAVDYICTVLAD